MNLHTRLSLKECQARLEAGVDRETLFASLHGSSPLLGTLRGSTFRLHKRRWYRNSHAPVFYGRFVRCPRGTRIEGRFGLRRDALIFTMLSICFLGVVWVATLIGAIRGSRRFTDVFFPLGLICFFLALSKFSYWLGRGEKKFIVEFLKERLEAQEEIQTDLER